MFSTRFYEFYVRLSILLSEIALKILLPTLTRNEAYILKKESDVKRCWIYERQIKRVCRFRRFSSKKTKEKHCPQS